MTDVVEEKWLPCPLFLSSLSRYRDEHVIDVMKCALRRTQPVLERPGRSRQVMEASNNLAASPYSMRCIHDLGVVYTSEGQWEKAANVMLRGWKRADEIEDEHVRFRFLMKLCETSFRIGKPLQAFAVLKSIDPPASKEDMPAFQVMSVQVFCAVGDVQKALSTFRKAIENQDYRNALTMLALVADDLRAARAFHAVRDAVKAKCTREERAECLHQCARMGEDGELGIIEHYVSVKDSSKGVCKTSAVWHAAVIHSKRAGMPEMANPCSVSAAVRLRPSRGAAAWDVAPGCLTDRRSGERWHFDQVFGPAAGTQELYERSVHQVVAAFGRGATCTVFACGHRASGKTYTMQGDGRAPGITQLAAAQLWEALPHRRYVLQASYFELQSCKSAQRCATVCTDSFTR
ncbi:unnamed protein product, partial [Effrenium voratum]